MNLKLSPCLYIFPFLCWTYIMSLKYICSVMADIWQNVTVLAQQRQHKAIAIPWVFSKNIQLIEWCFTPLSTVFQLYHGKSLHYLCLSWVSPVLGWGFEVSCPRTLPRKKPRGSRAARTQDLWIMSQTLSHWATQDPSKTAELKLKC